jgi:hypothetical protein
MTVLILAEGHIHERFGILRPKRRGWSIASWGVASWGVAGVAPGYGEDGLRPSRFLFRSHSGDTFPTARGRIGPLDSVRIINV